jgi:surface protein
MTIDATNGLISNDLRKAEGNIFVGKGTKMTVPARYGATYKLLTTKPLSDVSIEGSKDFVFSKVGDKHLATMQYYRTDLDSVVIEIGEDIELIRLEANYPGGDNELMVRPTVNKAESTITTQLKSGESGGLLYNLSDVQNRGNLKVTPSAYQTGTSLIEMPAQFDENRYMSISFEVKEGYSFKPKTTNLYTMPVNTGNKANVRLMLIDEFGNKADTIFQNVAQNVMKLDTLKPKAPSKAEELCLYGKIELRIYVYGTEGNYRLGDSITIGGELCQTIRFPEGQTYVPRLITSPIDFDGIGLVTIDAFEVVHADENTQLVTMTALEECPMGNVMLLKSDIPGGLYNIPLTRADDSYIAGQSILKVSDGTVIGTKHHYVFGVRDGVYGFFMAAIGDPIAEGNVYFYHNGIKDLLAYYINPNDVPPMVDEVILFADGDNNKIIKDYNGRLVSRVTLGGRTFYKDGRWNVVTLPFNILGRDIKKTPLKNATICEFDPEYTSFDAATGQLNLTFEHAYEIEAGKPYLVSWNKGEDLPNHTFENVTFFDNSLVEETSSDGHVTFHPSYTPIDFKNSDKTLMTVRKSMASDSCMHAMKAYFTIEATSIGVTDVDVDISVDNPSESMEVTDANGLYAVLFNKVVDFDNVTLVDYTGEGGIVEIADSITAIIDGEDVELAVRSFDANVFSSLGHEITALDMSRCNGLKPLVIDRTTPDTPFFGLNEGAIVYLPAGKAQPADNVVVGGICNRLILDDQYGFTPLYNFTAQQVVLNRSTTAANGWQALCLPFTLTKQMTQNWKGELLAFAGAKKENGTLTLFCNESKAVPAGIPAIVRWTDGAPDKMMFSNIDIITAKADSADYNGVSLYGSYMPVTFSETDLAKLFVVDSRTDSYMLPGFQAYFMMDDETTDDFSSVCVSYANVADFEAVESLTGPYDAVYAIWCEDSKTLYFTVPESRVNVGDSYNEHTVTMIWKGADVLMTGDNVPRWEMVNKQVEQVVFDESFKRTRPTSCYKWFYNFKKLTNIEGLHNLCTSEVTTMASMFDGCSALKELTLGFFDTSNVTDMNSMFYGCIALEHLNLLEWKTWQVTDMEYMFSRCHNLSNLYLDNLDTRSVTNMMYMFYDCRKLTDINLTNFDTSNVDYMVGMFKNCHSLKDLDLTSFNTSNVTNVQFMFENDYALTTITVGEGWTMENVQSSSFMFHLDGSLIGQNGTRYQYEYDNNSINYAHVDGGDDNPGLLWGVVDVALKDLADNSKTLSRYGGHRVNVTYDREFSAIENADGTWTSRAFTVCIPYEKDLSDYFDAGQIRLYQLAFANDDHEFTFIGQAPLMNAGTPYLLVVENGTVSLDAENVKMLPHPNEQIEEDIVYSDFETWGEPNDPVGWWRGTFSIISNEECTRMHAFALSMKDGLWKTFNNDTEGHRASYIPQFRSYFIPFEYKGPDDYVTRFKYIPAGDDDVNPDDWERLPDEFVGDINEDGTGIKPVIHTIDGDGTHRYYDLSGRRLGGKPQRGIYIDNGVKRIKK